MKYRIIQTYYDGVLIEHRDYVYSFFDLKAEEIRLLPSDEQDLSFEDALNILCKCCNYKLISITKGKNKCSMDCLICVFEVIDNSNEIFI